MDLDRIKVAYFDDTKRIWLVRASGGRFIDHFNKEGIIAIGHLDDVYDHTKSSPKDTKAPTAPHIKEILLRTEKFSHVPQGSQDNKRELNSSGRTKIQQIVSFSEGIRKGDIVISADTYQVMIGVCTESAAYLDETPVKFILPPELAKSREQPRDLKYRLRKKITWGPKIPRYKLPNAIKKTFQGQKTVIGLDKHWDKFYHLLYPFFVDDKNLYISNKIGSTAAINNLIVGTLLQNISLVQLLALELETSGSISKSSIEKLLELNISTDKINASTKAEFMSPGDLWSKIPLESFNDKASAALLCITLAIVLNGYASADEVINSLPDSNSTNSNYTSPGSMASDIFKVPKRIKAKQKATENLEN